MVLAANSDKVKNLIGEQMGVRALSWLSSPAMLATPPIWPATLTPHQADWPSRAELCGGPPALRASPVALGWPADGRFG